MTDKACDEDALYPPGSLAADMEVARAAVVDFARAWWQAVRESLTAVIERMTRPLWRGSDRIERGTGNDHLPKD